MVSNRLLDAALLLGEKEKEEEYIYPRKVYYYCNQNAEMTN